MAASIEVNIDELKRTGELFENGGEICKAAGDRIKAVTEDLLNNWVGESKNAFESKYKEIKNQMSSYEQLLMQISKDINGVADKFSEADEAISRQIK